MANNMITRSHQKWRLFILFFIIQSINLRICLAGSIYANESKLFDDFFGSGSVYNTAVRPCLNKESYTEVGVAFELIAIMEVETVTQRFSVNGVLLMTWTDELLTWNPDSYGGITFIRPNPSQIWRPRVILANTVADRYLLREDVSPVTLMSNGTVIWWPGSQFPSLCSLDLYKYPFDSQTCYLEFYTMGQTNAEIQFKASPSSKVGVTWFQENGEFEITDTAILTYNNLTNLPLPFKIKFTVRRLPGYFIINILLPITTMSILNLLVFTIPIESDEKISYSLTLLLTLSVFMGVVSDQLPSSSNIIPLITVYILILLFASAAGVLVTLWTIRLKQWVEDETEKQKEKNVGKIKDLSRKIKLLNRAIYPMTTSHKEHQSSDEFGPDDDLETLNSKELSLSHQEKIKCIINSLGEECCNNVSGSITSAAFSPAAAATETGAANQTSRSESFIQQNGNSRNINYNNSNINNNNNNYNNNNNESCKSRFSLRSDSSWNLPVVFKRQSWVEEGRGANVGGRGVDCSDRGRVEEKNRLEFWKSVLENIDCWSLRIFSLLWLVITSIFLIILTN